MTIRRMISRAAMMLVLMVLTASAWARDTYYIDASGTSHNVTATPLTGSGEASTTTLGSDGTETWYVVQNDANVAYHEINCRGNVNIILEDGAEMTVSHSGTGAAILVGQSITIYGQTLGSGTLSVTNTSDDGIYSSVGNITITGGMVTVTSTNNDGIYSYQGNITINGGKVTAAGDGTNSYGIYSNEGDIILSWTRSTDVIKANSYKVDDDAVRIKEGMTFLTDDAMPAVVSGTVGDLSLINGKTLSPAYDIRLQDNADNDAAITADYLDGVPQFVTLAGRTLYKDGAWNTLCLPFSLTAEQIAAHADFAGATLKELDTDGTNGFDATDGTLWLSFKTATAIAAGVPYIVKWDKAADYDSNPSAYDFTSPVFSGVTIDATASTTVSDADGELEEVQMVGCYSPVSVTANDKSILFLGDANTLYYSSIDRNIRPMRAYFSVPYIKGNPSATARAFQLDFGDGEETGISATLNDKREMINDKWYTLDGRKLNGKPTKSGVYINNGRKFIIK